MIQVKNLVKEFDSLRALDGLCLTVPDGCVYGLVGPNGAGKTTVIRHLTGVYRQDSGAVFIDGQPVYENPAVKQRIVCIPDELYARGSETIRDMTRRVFASSARSLHWTKNGPSAGFPRVCRSRPRSGWPFPVVRII